MIVSLFRGSWKFARDVEESIGRDRAGRKSRGQFTFKIGNLADSLDLKIFSNLIGSSRL